MGDGDFWANERHDPRFGRCQIAVEIHFQHSLHIRRLRDSISRQLWQVRFWEPAQGDQDLRIGLAQDCGNLVWFQQRVDGIGDARNAAPHKGQGRLATDRQKIGHDIIFPNTQAAE